MLVQAQLLTRKPEESAREALRVARAVQVDLELNSGKQRVVTLDICIAGFFLSWLRTHTWEFLPPKSIARCSTAGLLSPCALERVKECGAHKRYRVKKEEASHSIKSFWFAFLVRGGVRLRLGLVERLGIARAQLDRLVHRHRGVLVRGDILPADGERALARLLRAVELDL